MGFSGAAWACTYPVTLQEINKTLVAIDAGGGEVGIHQRTRLRRALEEFVIDGVHTTIPAHRRLIEASDFLDGAYDIKWLEAWIANGGLDGV